MIKSLANWYTIPGFTSYEINIHNKQVRSNKHYKKDSHHIMKVYGNNTIKIVDDFGKPTRVNVDDLYELTFNSGYKLNPRGDDEVYISGMYKGMRNSIAEVVAKKDEEYVTLNFYEMAMGSKEFIKPFTINSGENF